MPMLFDDDVPLQLTPDEWVVVTRPNKGPGGGAQRLLREILATQQTGSAKLLVTYVMLDRSHHYAYAYDDGGFQDRFRAICAAGIRSGRWTPNGYAPPRRNSGGAFGRKKKKKP